MQLLDAERVQLMKLKDDQERKQRQIVLQN